MILIDGMRHKHDERIPRMSGDDPEDEFLSWVYDKYSPHERG